MKQKWIALLLASAMVFSLLSASVAAVDEKDSETESEARTEEVEAEQPVAVPPAEETLTFESIADRVKQNNYTALALSENIAILDEIDYDKLKEDLRDGLHEIADIQWSLTVGGGSSPEMEMLNAALTGYALNGSDSEKVFATAITGLQSGMSMLQSAFAESTNAQLQVQYDALKEQLDDIKSGKLQRTNEGVKLQLQTAQNQMVIGAQTVYITLLGLERSDAAIARSLAALDRTIEEMELRCEMGQISELQLSQVKSGRTQLVSGRQTLQMNMDILRMQLNAMLGEELSAKPALQPLTAVTQEQLDAMNISTDYVQAEKVSYETYAAQKSLDDAEEVYKDAKKEYGENSRKMEYTQAKHTRQAAQYTYEAAMQSFSLKFRTLYAQVKDCAQILDAARSALALEQSEYKAAQLKHQQGALSNNALLDAENELLSAQDAVSDAESELYSAYNSYHWAVAYGILN